MTYTCLCGNEEKVKKLFLSLPKKLYEKKLNIQDTKTEKAILSGTHPLSKDMTVCPYVVIDNEKKVIGRCLLTIYDDDEAAYVGYYECYDDVEASGIMLTKVAEDAKALGKTSLVGPMDASFWIRYRFKINHFDKVYTSEPYNLPYYVRLWEEAGFTVSAHYASNQGRVPLEDDIDEKCKKRYERALKKGYEFRHPTKKTFEKSLGDVYDLLIELYKNFPGFRFISKEDFLTQYQSLKIALDYDMVYLAYYEDKLAGFLVNVPNYEEAAMGNLTFAKLCKLLKLKRKPKEYVLLYMGADMKHLGLGGAFAQIVRDDLVKKGVPYIGALIQDGKHTNYYYDFLNVDKYEYVLMSKRL